MPVNEYVEGEPCAASRFVYPPDAPEHQIPDEYTEIAKRLVDGVYEARTREEAAANRSNLEKIAYKVGYFVGRTIQENRPINDESVDSQ